MRKSEINFKVKLDDQNIPEKIWWLATDGNPEFKEIKSVSLNVWDHNLQNTLMIDLWTKDMRVDDMKRFYVDILGGMSQSILSATGDTHMANKIKKLREELVESIKIEQKGGK